MLKKVTVLAVLFALTGCGGGGSDSGGDQALSDNIDAQLLEFCESLTAEELAQNSECQERLASQ